MNITKELIERGLIADTTTDITEILAKSRIIYLGIDPTADSLHVGHLVPLLLMKRLQNAGHTPLFLMGGATGIIGDPKERGERSLLDIKILRSNVRALKVQLRNLFGARVRILNNADWLLKISLLPFLRDIGKHFTVNELIKHEIIHRRLTTPNESISYTEFTYALLQGYDYLTLHQKYNCDVQIGASDQWTNILSGVELIRRKNGESAYGFTVPLITDASGKKLGKSEGNAVWLDPKKTSPFEFYQFWMNQPDEILHTYFKFYSFLSLREISALMELHRRSPSERRGQAMLARSMTELVHGKEKAKAVARASETLFGISPLSELPKEARTVLVNDAPTLRVGASLTVLDAVCDSGAASSKSDARRLIEGNGVSLNGVTIEKNRPLIAADFTNGLAILRKGKREVVVLILK